MGIKMSTYANAVAHVKSGGKAWEANSWDTEAYLYFSEGRLCIYYTDCADHEPYEVNEDDKLSTNWELF